MSIEVNHLIVPATDKTASARFLADVLGLEPGRPISHFQPLQIGHVTLDFDNATDIRPFHIAFLVDDETFELMATPYSPEPQAQPPQAR